MNTLTQTKPHTAILGVGIATLDIINIVETYPDEDSEVRALSQRRCRGGNATNTLTVLSHLGHACAWAGVWVDNNDGHFIRAELEAAQIDMRYCHIETQACMPVSYITLNRANGSRTIIHYRDLPEFSFADFAHIDLSAYTWLHFEGRNVAETLRMLQHARRLPVRISLEVEKPRPGIEALYPYADVLLFGKQFVRTQHVTAQDFLRHLDLPDSNLVCAWGEEGAYGRGAGDTRIWHSPAFTPPRVVNTLGAGDTFNAGIIHALSQDMSLSQALTLACRLAGEKCGREDLI
jgi:ketohexokinase